MQISMLNNTPAPAAAPVTTSAPEVTSGNSAPPASAPLQQAESPISQKQNQPEGKEHTLSPDAQKAMLKESTEKFNKMSEDLNLDVKFAYNDKIDQVYLNVIDKHTGRVIRKLPSEEAMKISESMKELVGALLDKRG